MYSETSKSGVEPKRNTGSQPDFNTRLPCEKRRESNRPKCFGTSEIFFCECMKCPRRKDCEMLVSPWGFD